MPVNQSTVAPDTSNFSRRQASATPRLGALTSGPPGWRQLAILLIAAGALLVSAAPSAEAASHDRIRSCSYNSARVLGWIWADGSYNSRSNTFFFRTKSNAISDHMQRSLNALDIGFETGRSSDGHDTFRISLRGYGEAFLDHASTGDANIACRPKAFLASVIETEGSREGKVVDDPQSHRRRMVTSILDGLNIGWSQTRGDVMADRRDWPMFQRLPFVACGRVPGGSANCDLS